MPILDVGIVIKNIVRNFINRNTNTPFIPNPLLYKNIGINWKNLRIST